MEMSYINTEKTKKSAQRSIEDKQKKSQRLFMNSSQMLTVQSIQEAKVFL